MMCPFVVVVDSREQSPFAFEGLRTDAVLKHQTLTVPLLTKGIPSGDYSIEGCEAEIAVERKSLPDLFGSLGNGRHRFKREIERLAAMPYAAVVVEADWLAIFDSPPAYTRLRPKIVFRTVLAWQQQFPAVHWWMTPNRRFAEITTFRILERYWKRKASREVSSREAT